MEEDSKSYVDVKNEKNDAGEYQMVPKSAHTYGYRLHSLVAGFLRELVYSKTFQKSPDG